MRYIIAIILIILFVIVAIVTIGRISAPSSRTNVPASRVTKLANYADNTSASVSWTQSGHLVGDDQRRAIRVTVTPRTRTIEVLNGYSQVTERKQELDNTPQAFQQFTRALDKANFGKERTVAQPDERGVCPLGYQYIYRLTEASREVMRTWSDSCLNTDGPSAGNASLISQLFRNQITNYGKFTSNVQL